MLRKILLGACVVGFTATGLEAQDGTLGRSYLITPKLGMTSQFEAALGAHAALRRAENDPWRWSVYVVETGDDAGSYFIRSGDHTWADFDSYDRADAFQMKAAEHWGTVVAPLVGEWSSGISAIDTSLSWMPAPLTGPAPFVNITTFKVRSGMQAQFIGAVGEARAALAKGNWAHPFVWAYPISGFDDGPLIWLVTFHDSWSDMAEPDPSFDAVMTSAMGAEAFGKWQERVGASLRGTEGITMRYRPELSVMP